MMNLVDNEEIESMSDLMHVAIGSLEGRDRYRRQAPYPVAITPDRIAVHGVDFPRPLIEQDTSRHQA